jgi:hypothetical protein
MNMKVFVSHSWQDKFYAQKLADSIKEMGIELWLDANNLLPGEHIQETIDQVLGHVDLVLLLWSENSSKSSGVLAEIETSINLNKIILPCVLDGTSLKAHPHLSTVKNLKLNNFDEGIGRLKMVILNYMSRDFGSNKFQAIAQLNEFIGALETVNHVYKVAGNSAQKSTQENEYWENKIITTETRAFNALQQEQEKAAHIHAFMQEQMSCLETGLHDKQVVKQVLDRVYGNVFAQDPLLQDFIQHVESIYASFSQNQHINIIAKYRTELEAELGKFKATLKSYLGWLGDMLLDASMENTSYYFLSSADNLARLCELTTDLEPENMMSELSQELIKYLDTPGGFIDNNEGLIGYADDAFFIHVVIAFLVERQLIDTTSWNLDWQKLQTGQELVFNFIREDVKQDMQNRITAYLQSMYQKYYPEPETNHSQLERQQQELEALRNQVWEGKLMSIETGMIHKPIW